MDIGILGLGFRGSMGIMEKNMETTRMGYIRFRGLGFRAPPLLPHTQGVPL